jgi:hypothetical protein
MLQTARDSPNLNEFALVCLLGLRLMEATALDISDLGERPRPPRGPRVRQGSQGRARADATGHGSRRTP